MPSQPSGPGVQRLGKAAFAVALQPVFVGIAFTDAGDGGAQLLVGREFKVHLAFLGFRGIGERAAPREQGVDGGLVVTGFRQQFAAVLAQRGSGADGGGRAGVAAAARRAQAAFGGVVLRADETGGGQVFVIQQVFDGVQAGRRDVGARQIGQPVVRGAVADDIGDEA